MSDAPSVAEVAMGSAKSGFCCAWLAIFSCTNASSTTLHVDTDAAITGGGDGHDAAERDADTDPSLDRDAAAMDSTDGGTATFTLTSSMLTSGEDFDAKYTCDGADISPPLSWKNAPAGTKSFALILTDLDDRVFGEERPFVQWALFNIPQAFQALPENVGSGPMPSNVPGASQVRAWSALGGVVGGNHYLGPCPDGRHRYALALYALDVETLEGLDTSKQPREIADRVESLEHVLGVAGILASYARPM